MIVSLNPEPKREEFDLLLENTLVTLQQNALSPRVIANNICTLSALIRGKKNRKNMTRSAFISVFILALFIMQKHHCFAQRTFGEWTVYSDNTNAKNIAVIEKSVFFAFDAALLEYDTHYQEYTTWNAVNGLSDTHITTIGTHTATKTLCVAYDNGNIDLIQNGRTTNIPDLYLASTILSKKIYSIRSHGEFIFLATDIGIVKVDPQKKQIADTYYPSNKQEAIISLCFLNDTLFALSSNRLYAAKSNHPAIAAPTSWIIDNRIVPIDSANEQYYDLESWNDSLYVVKRNNQQENDSLFVVRPQQLDPILVVPSTQGINSLQVVNEKLAINTQKQILLLNTDYSHFLTIQDYGFGQVDANAFMLFDNSYWIADAKLGAIKYNINETARRLPIDGHAQSDMFSMKWNEGILAIVPGFANKDVRKQIAPGLLIFKDQQWKMINKETSDLWKASHTWDNTSIAFDPTQPNIVAIGGVSKTPVSIVNWQTGVVIDTFGQFNSTLNAFNQDTIYVSSLTYDEHGNLWIANSYCQKPVKMRDKEGQWHEFSLGSDAAYKLTKRIYCDYNNDLWISVYDLGLFGLHPSNSIANTDEAKTVLLNHVLPTNNSKIYNPITFTMDYNRMLWIASDNGFAVLSNPPSAFNQRPDYGQMQYPKVRYGDDIDFVFTSVLINEIEVDGGNRKWIATKNQGLFLLSDNASVIVEHFTVNNSPLPSNNVIDVEIDHYTGEVFILTDRGLLSYRGDATAEDPTYSNVKIFPNPAYPDHDGLIAIQGIRYDSDVKITDIAGNLVYQTTSNGGTATWNGKTTDGQPVTTGVYLIWTASNLKQVNGRKSRYVGKVMVVN